MSFVSQAQWATSGSTLYFNVPNGHVGIGLSSTPQGPFQVYGGNAYLWGLNIGAGTSLAVITTATTTEEMSFQIGSTEYARINTSGNLLLGKTSQTNTAYKLDVNGSARINQVVVNTTGADFVFNSTYHLPSLDSVALYVKKFHHLEGIAPAGEVQRNGLDLGDNQTRLLQKIEELTLYNIEEDKKLKSLQSEVDQLKEILQTKTR
jgi:hypothetical protein